MSIIDAITKCEGTNFTAPLKQMSERGVTWVKYDSNQGFVSTEMRA